MPASRTPCLFPAEPVSRAAETASGWVTAHCDGGARGNPGPAGFGAVLRDENDVLLAEISEFLGVCSNNVAEYRGLLGCLGWAVEHRVAKLRVISDSDLMVKQIQGKYKVLSPDLRPLWEQARKLITKLARFEISHALRNKNKDADRLANEAMDRGMGRTVARPAAAARLASSVPAAPAKMLRGFTRNGVVEMLGNERLPDGVFVKIIPE